MKWATRLGRTLRERPLDASTGLGHDVILLGKPPRASQVRCRLQSWLGGEDWAPYYYAVPQDAAAEKERERLCPTTPPGFYD